MEPHCRASAALDHTDTMASSNDQHCPQVPQQIIFNIQSHGHPHHPSGHSHMLPLQQSHMVVPHQNIAAEQNMHYGQAHAKRTLADHPAVCSSLTGEPLHGQLTPSLQPCTQTYSEVKCHQRHNSSHEPAAVYVNMSELVTAMPGQLHHSSKTMHQNAEGMIVSGRTPCPDGHVPHGRYYPVPHHRQYVQNNGQISWQSQRQYMSPREQGAVPGQVFVSRGQARFNSQMSMPFRGQVHPHYMVNQEYADVCGSHHHPVYGELNNGSGRSTYPPQQQCVVQSGQRIMFARPSMHAPRFYSRTPADAQFVYYAPNSGIGASQQQSPSWSGPTPMVRQNVPVGYSNQPAWQQPVAVAYGSSSPGQHMPDYHLSPERQMTPEFCDNFGGTRQHSLASQSFSPGSLHCHRPSLNQGLHSGMVNVDEKYNSHVPEEGNSHSAAACQKYVSPVVTCPNATAATTCSTGGSKDSIDVICTTAPSHLLEHLADGRTSVSHNLCVSCTTAPSLSSYNHPGYYVQGTNVNGAWTVSAAGEYYSYGSASQCTPHPQTGQHGHPYSYHTSPSHIPYSCTVNYPSPRCGHPYQSHAEGIQWQGQVVEHPLHECRNALPDKIASQHRLELESSTAIAVTTCFEFINSTGSATTGCSLVCSASAPVTSCKVNQQDLDDTDKVHMARTVPMQSTALHTGHHVPFSSAAYTVNDHSTLHSSFISPISQAVSTTLADSMLSLTMSSVDSSSLVPLNASTVPVTKKDIPLVQDNHAEDVVAGTDSKNSLQITSDGLSSTRKSKGTKRSGSRKATTRTKKKKGLSLDADTFCIDSVKCDAVESVCRASNDIHTATTKTALSAESADRLCPVTSSSDEAAVVVPYGWRRHVDNGIVVYYRLHSLIFY